MSSSLVCCGPRWRTLIHSQVLSVILCGTIIFANELSEMKPYSHNFPLLMALINYLLCATYLLRPLVRRGLGVENNTTNEQKALAAASMAHATSQESAAHPALLALPEANLQPRVYWYMLAAFIDLEANFLVITAFSYTNATSVALLDCFTIPCAMFLSHFFLRAKYKKMHYLGVGICIVGLGCTILSDYLQEKKKYSSTPGSSSDATATGDVGTFTADSYVIGDLLCLGGAFLYACSNVLQEKLVKYADREMFIGRLGAFGSMFAVIQFFALEYTLLQTTQEEEGGRSPLADQTTLLFISGFVVCLFFFYANTSAFLQDEEGDAILFNLGLLTSDLYIVLYVFLTTGNWAHWLYLLAFVIVFLGLWLYHSEQSPQTLYKDVVHGRSAGDATFGSLGLDEDEDDSGFPENSLSRYHVTSQQLEHAGSRHSRRDPLVRSEIARMETAFSYNPLANSMQEDGDEDFDWVSSQPDEKQMRAWGF